ncbi:MAG: hypothetical protein ACYDDI_02820 [Candidatus Acidiferrales bacterium]
MRKLYVLKYALLLLLAAPTAVGQQVGGVNAPDAITLRVIRVTNTDVPEHVVADPDYAPTVTVKERSYSIKLMAETSTVRYQLSCGIVDRTETFPDTETHHYEYPYGYDRKNATVMDWFKEVPVSSEHPNGVATGGFRQGVRCTSFHVGDVVTFYSLDRLIWLSYTDAKGTSYTHGDKWKPDFATPSYLYTMKVEFDPYHNDLTGETVKSSMIEAAYTIVSEEEKRKAPAKNKK